MTFGFVRLSILVEMLVFGYLTNSWFRLGLWLCWLADHSLRQMLGLQPEIWPVGLCFRVARPDPGHIFEGP